MFVNEKCTVCKLLLFFQKDDLYTLQKFEKVLKVNIKITQEHQHRKRGEVCSSLEIILNVFKCLALSLVSLKHFDNSTSFLYFSWRSL